jgi:glycosyltransferase involved in cell wall biosynthesis
MYNPLVSIIIPCYNAKIYIQDCINNVVAQKYTNIEIIIVDGNSTDGTKEILNSNAIKYPNIMWISEKDNGVYDAMNKGVKMAAGEWIFFLGCDDVFKNDEVINHVFKADYSNKVNFIYGNVEFKYSKQIYNGAFNLFRILFEGNICHQAIFYHKSIFNIIGLFDTACKIYADHDFNILCFMNKHVKTQYLNQIIAIYNERDGLSALQRQDDIFRKKQALYIDKFNRTPSRFIQLKFQLLKSFAKKIIRKVIDV